MNFELKSLDCEALAAHKTDALVILIAQSAIAGTNKDKAVIKPLKIAKTNALALLLSAAQAAGDFDGRHGCVLSSWRFTGFASQRIVLVGIGSGEAKKVRHAVALALQSLMESSTKKITIAFSQTPQSGALRASMHAAADTLYTYTTTKPSAKPSKLQTVQMGVASEANTSALKSEFKQTLAALQGIAFAKEWANRPANHATPTMLAQAAKSLSAGKGIQCQILGLKEIKKMGMGAFMAVAQGSREPMQFIILKYTGAAKSDAPVVLIGKGITFDTGGISIKPAEGMDEMKFDMSGAASVLGVFRALGECQPKINVVGLIPACENMPDGLAIKPGDVVTSMSGQTIEILNTDAEGRLVLCDALTYAERFNPKAVIDIATLTGACVIALGAVRSGLFSTNDALASELQAAGETALDLCWRMPLDEEYAIGLKTNFADVANVAGRPGGSITAAKFLQRFATKFPWAHLDIAGTAWKSGAAKGATGRPVSLLLQYLLQPTPQRSA